MRTSMQSWLFGGGARNNERFVHFASAGGAGPQALKAHSVSFIAKTFMVFIMADFKSGDVVKLKSGGPKMTVTGIGDHYGTATVWCSWFDGTKKVDGTFPPAALEVA